MVAVGLLISFLFLFFLRSTPISPNSRSFPPPISSDLALWCLPSSPVRDLFLPDVVADGGLLWQQRSAGRGWILVGLDLVCRFYRFFLFSVLLEPFQPVPHNLRAVYAHPQFQALFVFPGQSAAPSSFFTLAYGGASGVVSDLSCSLLWCWQAVSSDVWTVIASWIWCSVGNFDMIYWHLVCDRGMCVDFGPVCIWLFGFNYAISDNHRNNLFWVDGFRIGLAISNQISSDSGYLACLYPSRFLGWGSALILQSYCQSYYTDRYSSPSIPIWNFLSIWMLFLQSEVLAKGSVGFLVRSCVVSRCLVDILVPNHCRSTLKINHHRIFFLAFTCCIGLFVLVQWYLTLSSQCSCNYSLYCSDNYQ